MLGVAGGEGGFALEGNMRFQEEEEEVVGASDSHVTHRQPTVTSVTRSPGGPYPIMSGMLAVT